MRKTPRALEREQRQRPVLDPGREPAQGQPDQHRQAQDAAQQAASHRDIGRQWQAIDRRQPAQAEGQQQQGRAGPGREPGWTIGLHGPALERLCRCQAAHRERRPPAAEPGGADAEQAVAGGSQRIPVQAGRDGIEIAAAQVAAEQPQCGPGQRRAQRHPEQAANGPQQHRFGPDQVLALARIEPEHAEQREGRQALGHAQAQYREHQEGASEQRDQGQHRQVDPVGARELAEPGPAVAGLVQQQLAAIERLGPSRGLAGLGSLAQRGQQQLGLGAGLEAQVDAADEAGVAAEVLQGRHVHREQRRPALRDPARQAQPLALQADLDQDRIGLGIGLVRSLPGRVGRRSGVFRGAAGAITAGRIMDDAPGRRIGKHGIGSENGQPVDAGVGLQRQRRLDRRHAESVQPPQAHGLALAQGIEQLGLQLEHRAGFAHAGLGAREIEPALVEPSRQATQLGVGLAAGALGRGRELGQRRGIDQLHRQRQPDPEHDRQHRHRMAPGVQAQLLPGKGLEQGPIGGQAHPFNPPPCRRASGAAAGRPDQLPPASASPAPALRPAPGSGPAAVP